MQHDEYVRERAARSPEFRAAMDLLDLEFAFAIELLRARAEANLTQSELADLVGTKRPNIARLESGGHTPSIDMLQRLAAALGVEFEITAEAGLRVKESVS